MERDLADHLEPVADQEHKPSDALEHEQPLVLVAGGRSDSGGVRAVNNESTEEDLRAKNSDDRRRDCGGGGGGSWMRRDG